MLEKKFPLKKEKDCYLYADDGKKYLDFVQGIAVNSLGHCHSHLIKTINKQSKKLWSVSNAFTILEQEKLAAKIMQAYFCGCSCFSKFRHRSDRVSDKISQKIFLFSRKKK
jgi:acetylornithine/N-succinyldiaminopimelate aminotransferase